MSLSLSSSTNTIPVVFESFSRLRGIMLFAAASMSVFPSQPPRRDGTLEFTGRSTSGAYDWRLLLRADTGAIGHHKRQRHHRLNVVGRRKFVNGVFVGP